MALHSMHTHTCGELRAADAGKEVRLTGWVDHRRDLGQLIFVTIRDREGMTQVIFDPDLSGEAFATAETIRPEWPILVTGTVRHRIEGQTNEHMATGEIEVLATGITVLNTSVTPPFPIDDATDTAEDIRLTEVETPSLFKSTPEGARDFLVPSRTQPGHFYALPQSPQLLKQLLMIGGVERYYQVAKCFRDEDLRADRQPEFTQVDVEMSFVEQDDVMATIEDVLHDAFAKVGVDMPTPLRRISYWDAMDTYGIDKPDTRFGMTLHDVTSIFAGSAFRLFAAAAETEGQYVKCINAKGAGSWPRARIDKLGEVAADLGAKGLAWFAFKEDGSWNSSFKKFVSEVEIEALRAEMDAEPGDLLLFAVADRLQADEILGGMRLHMADALEIPREGHDFLWVVDFPLFHWDEERGAFAAEHQPFTQPMEDDIEKLASGDRDTILSCGSHTYDFVMDGFEAGGGGMRIHNADLQMQILELLGFTKERAEAQFGFLMEALTFGAPPMGGFALGLDRVCMLLTGSDSIREVMAFPKTSSGSDLMSAAPSKVTEAQLEELSLALRHE